MGEESGGRVLGEVERGERERGCGWGEGEDGGKERR